MVMRKWERGMAICEEIEKAQSVSRKLSLPFGYAAIENPTEWRAINDIHLLRHSGYSANMIAEALVKLDITYRGRTFKPRHVLDILKQYPTEKGEFSELTEYDIACLDSQML